MDLPASPRHVVHVNEGTDQVGFLLARVAGLLEVASTLSAIADTARDEAPIAALQLFVADAAALLAAAQVLVVTKVPRRIE